MSQRVNVASYELKLAAPLAAFFFVFFLTPLALLLILSFQTTPEGTSYGLTQYKFFLTDDFSMGVLGSTLLLGLKVTIVCLIFGYPIALVYMRSTSTVRSVILLIVLLPLLTSVVVRTFAWIVILGRQGIVNSMLLSAGLVDTPLRLLYSDTGLVIALAQVQMPLMVLPLIAALSRIDSNLSDASYALGAGHWRTFFKVILPLSLPGMIAGSVLTYSSAIAAFVTQTLIGGGQKVFMPLYIYQQAMSLQNWPFASAISIIFLVAVLAIVVVFNMLGRMSTRSLG